MKFSHAGVDGNHRPMGTVYYSGSLRENLGSGTFYKPGTSCEGTFTAKRISHDARANSAAALKRRPMTTNETRPAEKNSRGMIGVDKMGAKVLFAVARRWRHESAERRAWNSLGWEGYSPLDNPRDINRADERRGGRLR
jgi:hypothetical protein